MSIRSFDISDPEHQDSKRVDVLAEHLLQLRIWVLPEVSVVFLLFADTVDQTNLGSNVVVPLCLFLL